ncbi:hypothetical protein MGG_13156 [Pyricularia oryzae 70-15]|uniref:C2H2 type master regulator of conidiophore development brlA n=4 Tax=Pyricularia oryzae TaxID=318829 RepID=G4MPH0_PYRO7|nr:uncharacterized protein MGG_13156 [Pyricularia oryzae 70-15]AEK70430.1 Prg1 [Pyricularia oryzae]ELQ37875.1 hypothetical protein OOU_Y34scaffold00567g22 [Pyricularia oryzae Y34]EHA58013.1 hypothetical protein MGG_13156 [Pyricularia oryzae 70-15]KAI7915482.1 hypothetical protein M9X92_008397 [Pyricularia oryzae]KAI7928129.1 hypothetical protein M0657_002812 [Pyricularia oryzae]
MHARDAAGRQVSLLNDDAPSYSPPVEYSTVQRLSYSTANHVLSRPFNAALARSASASPNAPQLSRSDSYDSQNSSEPLSPMTPNVMYADYGHPTPALYSSSESTTPYDDYLPDAPPPTSSAKRPVTFGSRSSRSGSYDDDMAGSGNSSSNPTSTGKRYPCRYRDSHGCEKTFTTSGHASRHSKIHTAEKAVQCTYPGCNKKFTRADNMKQHLETHYKDRNRSGATRPTVSARRSSSSSKHSSGSSSGSTAGPKVVDSSTPLPSPGIQGSNWHMRTFNGSLLARPVPSRNMSIGLDALAAVACQEGA